MGEGEVQGDVEVEELEVEGEVEGDEEVEEVLESCTVLPSYCTSRLPHHT